MRKLNQKDKYYVLKPLPNISSFKHAQMAPFPGGVVIKAAEGGDIVGAVGVSGASADEDEFCALAGVQEAGLEGVVTEPVQHALKS